MRRIPSLDGLRAISITLVLAGHFTYSEYHGSEMAGFAQLGVRVFFVISGYLITMLLIREHAATETINLHNFYLRRAYRILPAAMAFTIPILILYRSEMHWYDAASAIFYFVDFRPATPWIVGHLWSLSVEEQFYFLWPSVLKKWHRYRVPILVAIAIQVPFFRTACYYFKVALGGDRMFFGVADCLAIGCLAAMFEGRIGRIKPWMAALMVVAVVAVNYYPANTPLRTMFLLFVLTPISHLSIAGILLHVVQTPYRALNVAPMVWLGKISYSLYLWQQPFFYNPIRPPLYFYLLAFGFACLSYYLVERPLLKIRDASPQTRRPHFTAAATAAQAGD